MRLFIAIQLSDEMKKTVTGTMHELKKAGVKGGYVPLQNLHVTLAFRRSSRPASVSPALSMRQKFPMTTRNLHHTSQSSAKWEVLGKKCPRRRER